jgi:iron complex outermembrane recepter protein
MFYRSTIAVLLLTFFLLENSQAQSPSCTLSLSGKVVLPDGTPAANASVYLSVNKRGMLTDSTGSFRLDNLCVANDDVEVKLIGYFDYEQQITISATEPLTVMLKENVTQLATVEVQGELLETEHAHNMTTMNEQQLAETAGKSLGESLKEIAGVNTIQSGPGIFKPVIHGVHSQRILILNYGIRQEGQQWGAEHAPEIDPFIASDITVIKDASSIKYGTDALGGVIVVNPPELPETNTLGGSVQSVLQSNGRSGAFSGMIEGGIAKLMGWGWRVQGTLKRAGDYHTPDYSLTNTGVKELNFSGALGYHHENKGLEIFFSRFSSELGILRGTSIGNVDDLEIAMLREPPQYTTDFSYHIGEPRQEVDHNLLKINGHLKTKYGLLRMQYGFQNNTRKEFDIRKGNLSAIPSINLELNSHTLESEFERSISPKSTLCVGVTGMLQSNYNIPGTQRIPFIPNFTNTSAGAFAISKFNFDRGSIDFGVRYDFRNFTVRGYDFKNTFYSDAYSFHNASATLGGTIRFTRHSTISSNLSAAWRPPHVAELFSVGTHQSAAAIEYGLLLNDSSEVQRFSASKVKSEQAFKWVTSYGLEKKNFSLNVTGYANYITNYIFLKPVGVTKTLRGVYPTLKYYQTDAMFLGADISSAWHVTERLAWNSKLSLLRATDVLNNDYLLYIPSSRFETSFRYMVNSIGMFKNLYLEPKAKYVAKQGLAPRVITVTQFKESIHNGTDPLDGKSTNFDFTAAPNAYYLLGLSAGFSLRSEKVQYNFRASVENLMNTSYREYSNRFRYYADDIGRNFTLSFKCIF